MVLAAVALVTFAAYQRTEAERAIERHQELVSLSGARLQEEQKKFTDVLASLARSEGIYRDSPVGRRIALRQAGLRLAVFDGGVVLLDNFGRLVAAEPGRPEILGDDWSNRDYFRNMLSSHSVVVFDAVADGPDRPEVVVLAVPITGTGGEFLGTLAGMFRVGSPAVSAFYASIVRLRIGEGGSTYLVDGNGRVIYHSDPEHLGETLTAQSPVAPILKGESGARRTRNHDGQDIVAAFAPVPGTSWGLVTEEDWAFLTSSGRRYGQFLLFFLALGMILSAVGVRLFVRQRQAEVLERHRIEQ
jgi:hypothetical protein